MTEFFHLRRGKGSKPTWTSGQKRCARLTELLLLLLVAVCITGCTTPGDRQNEQQGFPAPIAPTGMAQP
ncbi:hypothetical protein SBV1_1450024 [Verrucomicrobia bacterium]|nr:hypothetical protein SBV1_1450024 [Verrucomicrobiota bacterium]